MYFKYLSHLRAKVKETPSLKTADRSNNGNDNVNNIKPFMAGSWLVKKQINRQTADRQTDRQTDRSIYSQ